MTAPADRQPRSARHLSTLTLHQLRYGELEGEDAAEARAHLDSCSQCRQRQQGQQAFRRAFEIAPPAIELPQPAGPSFWEQARGWLRWAPAPVLALAAALLLFVNMPDNAGQTGTSATERTKGLDQVVLVVEGHGVLDADESIEPGDRLQIRVPAGPWQEAWVGDGQALIGSFDLSPERATTSPFALDVDGEPGDEELVIILAEDPLGEDGAAAAMHGRRMDGVAVRRLTLNKVD